MAIREVPVDSVVKTADGAGGLAQAHCQLQNKDAVESGEEGLVVGARSGVWVSAPGSSSEGWWFGSTPQLC